MFKRRKFFILVLVFVASLYFVTVKKIPESNTIDTQPEHYIIKTEIPIRVEMTNNNEEKKSPTGTSDLVSNNLLQRKEQSTFIPKEDYNCLKTLDVIIERDEEGNFIIPSREVLSKLPENVIDCLYHRYTTTLQTFCAKRSRHGGLLHGWNMCIDGCYKPNKDTQFYIISMNNEHEGDAGIKETYSSKIRWYFLKDAINSDRQLDLVEYCQLKSSEGNKMRFPLTMTVKQSKNYEGVIIIDIGNFTELASNHILENDILAHIQQLSIFTSYGDDENTHIDYITALDHLRQFYDHGFRIYWSRMERRCILKNNPNRTSCVQLEMVYKNCRNASKSIEHQHLVLPNNTILSKMSKPEVENLYHRYLTSTQIYCKEIIRLGGIKDGGWDICNDRKYRPKDRCLVYSFGINWNFKFDVAIAETYGCEVHSFDPSMNTTDFKHSDLIWFHDLGISHRKDTYSSDRTWKFSNLKDIREELNHSSRKLDVIKMDIESTEWLTIPDMIQSGALSDVTQLFIEFHSPGNVQHLGIVKLLYEEGFKIFWNHRNPGCKLNRTFVQQSFCNEVYFART